MIIKPTTDIFSQYTPPGSSIGNRKTVINVRCGGERLWARRSRFHIGINDNLKGSVTISGEYNPQNGNCLYLSPLSCTAKPSNELYSFSGWFDFDGNTLSRSQTFTYTPVRDSDTVYARFDDRFDKDSLITEKLENVVVHEDSDQENDILYEVVLENIDEDVITATDSNNTLVEPERLEPILIDEDDNFQPDIVLVYDGNVYINDVISGKDNIRIDTREE